MNGYRVPILVESTASVRIVGASSFRMTYRYEEINATIVAPAGGVNAGGEVHQPVRR